jgi:para-nitrobenzyl esterase
MLERITVETASGPIQGRSKEDVFLFAGVPYAEPPVGNLRFKAPMPHTPWREPREALKFGPAAPQVATGGMTDAASVRWDEDCLTLNISTPACDDAKRAVLVWIHGGGYRTGQGSIPWYNGARFSANGDIVVVSINYRLGALGFTELSHLGAEYESASVAGILDQIAALRWVRDNIAQFGGDPQRVTIAGESAGGFSVSTLLGCESAQGLFHRAIPQSGGAHHTLPKSAAEIVTQHFLDTLNAHDPITLEAMSADDILAAQTATIAQFEGGAGVMNELGVAVSPFYPAHGTPLLPQSPLHNIRAGVGSDVAVLTGSNTDETTLWGYGDVDEAKLARIANGYGAGDALNVYRAQRPHAGPEEVLIALTTDHMFRIPAIRVAEARAAHTDDTWMYLFNWNSRAFEGRLKATHALEIPFAFNNLDRAGVDIFIGPGERPQHVAEVMHSAWTAFINSGDPGWERYDAERRATMVFDNTSQVSEDPAAVERMAWEGLR